MCRSVHKRIVRALKHNLDQVWLFQTTSNQKESNLLATHDNEHSEFFSGRIMGKPQEQEWKLLSTSLVRPLPVEMWETKLAGQAGGSATICFMFPDDPTAFLASLLLDPYPGYALLGILRTMGWARLRQAGVVTQLQVRAAMRGLNPLKFAEGEIVTRVRYIQGRHVCWDYQMLDGSVEQAITLERIQPLLWVAPGATEKSDFALLCRRHPGRWCDPEVDGTH